MDKALEELRLLIASCSESGEISKTDMEMLTVRARIMGLTPEELDVLIKSSGQNSVYDINNVNEKFFAPKVVHIVVALVLVIVIAVLVYISLYVSASEDSRNSAYLSLGDKPVTEVDLYHLYSGTYDGKSVLITVKDVKSDRGRYVVTFDIKCDFVPVAQNCRCFVNLDDSTFEFEESEIVAKKFPLGTGTIKRSATGKVVFQHSAGLYELLQL